MLYTNAPVITFNSADNFFSGQLSISKLRTFFFQGKYLFFNIFVNNTYITFTIRTNNSYNTLEYKKRKRYSYIPYYDLQKKSCVKSSWQLSISKLLVSTLRIFCTPHVFSTPHFLHAAYFRVSVSSLCCNEVDKIL